MSRSVSPLAPRYRGLWVALTDDRECVLASGKTAEEAFEKARKKRPETLVITHLPDDEVPNDDLLAAMAAAKAYLKSGDRKVYKTVDALMASLQ